MKLLNFFGLQNKWLEQYKDRVHSCKEILCVAEVTLQNDYCTVDW